MRRQAIELARMARHPLRTMDRLIDHRMLMMGLDAACDIVVGSQLPGDYLEFGVSTGYSLAHVYRTFSTLSQRWGDSTTRRFFGFDSFQGLPASNEAMKPAQYAEGAYAVDLDTVRGNLTRWGVRLDDVRLVEGWYDQLTEQHKKDHQLTRAAMIFIDCDLETSTKDALRFCRNLIHDGTVVVFDDFYRHGASPRHGVRGAWNDFLSSNPELDALPVALYRRAAFVLHRRES